MGEQLHGGVGDQFNYHQARLVNVLVKV